MTLSRFCECCKKLQRNSLCCQILFRDLAPKSAPTSPSPKIAVEDARLRQAATQYESAALKSPEAVENALIAYSCEHQRRAGLKQCVAESRRMVELANGLCLRGVGDFLSVLEEQKSRDTLEDELAQSETNMVVSLVALYKALGGGWIFRRLLKSSACRGISTSG